MRTQPRVISMAIRYSATNFSRLIRFITTASLLVAIMPIPIAAVAQNTQTQTPAPNPSNPQSPPAGTQTQNQQQQPGSLPPSPTQLPPNSGTAPLNPSNEAQQSTQPQTGLQQQRQQTSPNTTSPQPISPQQPSQPMNETGLPNSASPVGTAPAQTQGVPSTGTPTNTTTLGGSATPGQNVGVSPGIAPAQLPANPPIVAPNYKAPNRPLPSADRVGVDISKQAPLTLNEAIALALKNNNNIDASRIDVKVAEFNLQAAKGVYDPLFSTESYYERRTTPTSSTIGGGTNGSVTQTDPTADLRLGGYTPFWGGSYQVDFTSTYLSTNNQFATLNPQYPAALTFTYTQPLWRGLRFDANRRNIEVAKKNLSLSDAQFRQQVIDTISQVQQAYWDLVFALRNLQVQIDAVKQARTQVESNQRLVEQGVLAPIDIVAATTQVTTFEQNVYTAQEAVTTAENTLKTLILPNNSAPLWSSAITPITPVALEAPRVPLESALASALTNRPEIAQLQANADINSINSRYFRDQTKPQVDLVATYTGTGLAGTPTTAPASTTRGTSQVVFDRVNELSALSGLEPLPPASSGASTIAPNLVGGYPQSLSNILAGTYPTARVGVRISIPLRNRTAEANLGSSLAQGTRIQDQIAQTRQLIEADVRNNLQAVKSAEARLAAAAATRQSAELQYQSEERMFKAGTTTVFLVLQRQTDLLTAQGRELQAQTDLNKAISNLQRAIGTTMQANNVAMHNDTRELEIRPTGNSEPATSADGGIGATALP
jgi:outer membrane protein TolC